MIFRVWHAATVNPSEKFKPGTLIKPRPFLFGEDGSYERYWHGVTGEMADILFRTTGSIAEMWCEDGYRHTWENKDNLPKNWQDVFLRQIQKEDIYMVVESPKFCKVPDYLTRLAKSTQKARQTITYLGMIVSFDVYNWEIPLVVLVDSFFLKKLCNRMQMHELFESPDPWYSFNFEVVK